MDRNYASNSYKAKEESAKNESDRLESIASGKVREKEPSKFLKIVRLFISDDVVNLKSYILYDVLIPAIKKSALDIIKNGSEMVINGKVSKPTTTIGSRVSYNLVGSGTTATTSTSAPKPINSSFKEIIYPDREDAENVLQHMKDIIRAYGVVTVCQMFDLSNVPCDFVWSKYGWNDLSLAKVERIQDGDDIEYRIRLPKALPLIR